MACDKNGQVIRARLMGPEDLCAEIRMPWNPAEVRWCLKTYPHDGGHRFDGGPASWE